MVKGNMVHIQNRMLLSHKIRPTDRPGDHYVRCYSIGTETVHDYTHMWKPKGLLSQKQRIE